MADRLVTDRIGKSSESEKRWSSMLVEMAGRVAAFALHLAGCCYWSFS